MTNNCGYQLCWNPGAGAGRFGKAQLKNALLQEIYAVFHFLWHYLEKEVQFLLLNNYIVLLLGVLKYRNSNRSYSH